jgi:lon-related putative ATP-dependent protease
METARELQVELLYRKCDPAQVEFDTTDDVEELQGVVGQERALDAIKVGVGIKHFGYNLFVLGPVGTGKRTIVEDFLRKQAAAEKTPSDWCYVHNFTDHQKPQVFELPAGRGKELHGDMQGLVEELQSAVPAALEAEEHQSRVEEIERPAKAEHESDFNQLAKKALDQGIRVVRTPGGYGMAPLHDGEVITPEQFDELPKEEQEKIEATVESLQDELKQLVENVPERREVARRQIKELNREATRSAIGNSFDRIKQKYADFPKVFEFLGAVEHDIIDNADDFLQPDDEVPSFLRGPSPDETTFQRYKVNLLVDNSETNGTPVVYEDHPNYQNLLGRIEHRAHMGTLVTDFTLIKPGAIHRANGGYLIIDAMRLLQQPYAWEGLKRALHSRHVKIESLAESLSLVSGVSLEPEPVPLDTKIVMIGERVIYYLMYQYDRDFAELFKVAADFDDSFDWNSENVAVYARLIATLVRRESKRPFDRSAVARVIEHSARLADDSEKLSAQVQMLADLLREADYWASQVDAATVSASHVEKAIERQVHRVDRIRSRIQEEIQRGTLMIDTEGEQVGQVNGLSVLDLGNFAFGRPTRITANARLGKGEVVDIEREVELGGAIHSKGVMIISSLLATRYAKNQPLSLSASLVFEQSYGMIEGDSASVAELCALFSALAEAPVKQSLAVTGSVNQHGVVQPIGGVNEKIEGFFDVCQQRGLKDSQGVLIPAANVKHLMLRHDVVRAVAEGQFHVFAVETIDQAATLLTGVEAGERDSAGNYPAGSLNQRVAARLEELLKLRQDFSKTDNGGSDDAAE